MAKTGDSPERCTCHDEPMFWQRDSRYHAGGFYRCRVRVLAAQRERYHNLSGVAYNRLLLDHRRTKSLARRRNREAI